MDTMCFLAAVNSSRFSTQIDIGRAHQARVDTMDFEAKGRLEGHLMKRIDHCIGIAAILLQ